MLQQVLNNIEGLKNQIANIHVDHANLRGDFSTRLLEQVTVTDTKLMALERRFEEKIAKRAERVDDWFEDMQRMLTEYKIAMESRITAVSVKVGIIFAISSVVVATIIGIIIRALFAVPVGGQ